MKLLGVRKIIRFTLFVITVFYLLDAGVEASKNRKKHRHRSKRTHGDKRRSGKHRTVSESASASPVVNLVQKQGKVKKFSQHRRHRDRDVGQSVSYDLAIKQILKEKREKGNKKTTVPPTMMPVIEAKVDFFIKQKIQETFFTPPATPPTAINGISASKLGLLPFHNASGKYGLHTRARNIFGQIVHVSDAGRTNSHFGCGTAFSNANMIPQNNEPWIALIERGHCSFFTKIKLAEWYNASAVIFYDNNVQDVPKINTIGTRIVSVIIGKHDGHRVRKIVDGGATVLANIAVSTTALGGVSSPTSSPEHTPSFDRIVGEQTTTGGAMACNNSSIITTLFFTFIVIFYHCTVTS